MMATTLKQTEAAPAEFPFVSANLSSAAAALDEDMIWQRIETYVAHRWTERTVTWIAEGPGEWTPPLTPATITATEIWNTVDAAWESVTLDASPLGGYMLDAGPYRFTATVGGGSPAPTLPAAVLRAFVLLAEYMAADRGTPGVSRETTSVGPVTLATSRSASWMAAAMANSGAGDLLRPYRRA